MSIPKEPRQLMINLMYLVLTALLALNVSAEIFNAFKLVDDGINRSSGVLDDANEVKPDRIATLAQKSPEYAEYADRAKQARVLSKEFVDYVREIKQYMVDQSGGWDEKYNQPKGYKDKDITTRYLVGKDPAANAGKGGELEAKIAEYANKFLALVDSADRANFTGNIALRIDSTYTTSKDKKNWAHYNFFQMPLLSVMPILSKIENDAKSTEAAVLNYLLDKTGGEDIVFDNFILVSSPTKSYVISGETYETEISLSASSKNPEGLSISVNGSNQPLKDGVVKYTAKTSDTGVKEYAVRATITNPVTKEVTTVQRTFSYEVGRRSASIQLEKMNVFYIGVENPISVSAAGVSSNQLKVSNSGNIKLAANGPGKYTVTASSTGPASITLSAEGLAPMTFEYRVKPIPTPVAKLGRLAGGSMTVGEFKVQPGLIPVLEGFDFDAKCNIEGFRVIRQPKRDDPRIANNSGGGFGGEVQRLINEATPGDAFYFTDVKGKCPGDAASRALNTLVFTIR
jgi:gliding motility-associated protein GldM